MALTSLSLKVPITPPLRITRPNACLQFKSPPATSSPLIIHRKLLIANAKSRNGILIRRAVEESKESTESEATKEADITEEESGAEIGAEIKKAMMERKKAEKEGLLSGVAEEIEEIEWPAFGKVLGTTGVVLGVIAASSVFLLTVNAVLAELSDTVFAGRGVQDFFG
ncbi:preprotein translocase subunit SECE1 [Ricinus communis]|uniref:preprotein translocase subunit SECE1 n=1 Tax=Ricinus communis TaxID=3988 RepID=UPI00201AE7C3|nr:preprotein translocase subunit SECE1 [Ricinus communis]